MNAPNGTRVFFSITGVVADRDDPTGKTAVLVMSYIRPAYRGRGLTALFYEARLEWIASQPQFTRTIVSHRASNEASARVAATVTVTQRLGDEGFPRRR